MFNKVELGNRLFIARRNKNLKQVEVGRAINVNQSTYSKIETGKYDISVSALFILSDFLNVSVAWLLGIEEGKFTETERLEIEKFKKYLLSIRK